MAVPHVLRNPDDKPMLFDRPILSAMSTRRSGRASLVSAGLLVAGVLMTGGGPADGQVQPSQIFSEKGLHVEGGDPYAAQRFAGRTGTVCLYGVDAPKTDQHSEQRPCGQPSVRHWHSPWG